MKYLLLTLMCVIIVEPALAQDEPKPFMVVGESYYRMPLWSFVQDINEIQQEQALENAKEKCGTEEVQQISDFQTHRQFVFAPSAAEHTLITAIFSCEHKNQVFQ